MKQIHFQDFGDERYSVLDCFEPSFVCVKKKVRPLQRQRCIRRKLDYHKVSLGNGDRRMTAEQPHGKPLKFRRASSVLTVRPMCEAGCPGSLGSATNNVT